MAKKSMRNWLFTTVPKQLEYYEGMLIHADTHVHEQALELIKEYFAKNCSIIDIGSGAGAFSQRLVDEGYNVTGLDIDREKWIPSDIPFVQLDVDAGIQKSINRQFDAACCLEVIEHLENPWNLMREIRDIVKPDGLLLLSTPNITSFLSRIFFLIRGRFHQFNEDDLVYGHISPITEFELANIAKNVGWEIIEVRPGGYLPIFDFSNLTIKRMILNLLRGAVYLIARGPKKGWTLFFVMKKISRDLP